ncbi:MAG: Trk system potassium transporter TrkA [Lachnospiraceae bacterium]|nr:Trk system potassium transporter TrkA [Lachnospiraceae bacterium]
MSNPFSKNEKSLKIIIVGCGKVGMTLAERLSQEKHDVTVIDIDAEAIQKVTTLYDVMGVTGNGASFSVQDEAGIKKADLIIAVTSSDELNLLCCTIAQKVGECAAIARVRNPDYSEELSYLRKQLGISLIINPELETAKEMSRLLRLPTAISMNSFAKGHVELVKFKLPEDNMLVGKKIMEIGASKLGVLICGIESEGQLDIPDGSNVFKAGDLISFIATPLNTHKFFRHIGMKTHHVKDCIIVGGGKTSYYLAKQLSEMNINVKVIERDKKHCETLCTLLPNALVINGDGADESLLLEEGIKEAGSFIPLTGLDEENILLTLFAKKNSKAKVITKINRSTFNDVIDGLDIGSVIYPRYMSTETIIRYVRGMQNSIGSNIETLYHIFENRAEAIEFEITEESQITGKPLMELTLKEDLLVACINRRGRIIIPRGGDTIQPGDTVVIVTTHTGFKDVSDILR